MGRDNAAVDGYWKGQMLEQGIDDQTPTTGRRTDMRPRRILLELGEGSGIVQGRFARSSDMVAFRLTGDEGSRRIATSAVTGTLDGAQIRLRFSADDGHAYEVDAVVDGRAMVGGYVARYQADGAELTRSGQFEIERF